MQPFRLREFGSTLVHRIEDGADLVDVSIEHHRAAYGGDPVEAMARTLSMIVGNLIEHLPRARQLEICELWNFEELEAE